MNIYSELKNKIDNKKAVITVVGLGYVGLPMAIEFLKKGFKVIGLETDTARVERLKKGVSYISDISSAEISKILKNGNFTPTIESSVLEQSDIVIICVPTPITKVHEPDISFVVNAAQTISRYLVHGMLVVLESTTYPGTTREVVLPIFEQGGLKEGKDFFLAFSPERIDPANPKYNFSNIPKVVGSFTKKGTLLGKRLYSHVVKKVIGVSTPESAEVTKLLENTFRIVNIALINEFAHLCHDLGIDVWEVIKAAETKPFGFMPFYPGPGIGGHCIPADPIYLSWKARKIGFTTEMIDLAAKVNRNVPKHIVRRLEKLPDFRSEGLHGTKILIIGVSYKRDVNDLRDSPALDIISELSNKKAVVSYHDPYIRRLAVNGFELISVKLTNRVLREQDIVVIVTDHTCLDYEKIAEEARLIFDTRNIFGRRGIKSNKIIKL